jgi:hypothetical protein
LTSRRWLIVIVALVLWGLATHGTHAGEGDEPHYLAIAHSIAFDFDLDVSNNYGAREPFLGGGELEPRDHTRQGLDGQLRPIHDVGLPLLYAPFARVGVPLVSWLSPKLSPEIKRRLRVEPPTLYKHFVSAVMILVTVGLALQLFHGLLAAGVERRAALQWAALIVLSSPVLVMSVSFFTEIVSAALCFFVFTRLAQDKAQHARTLMLCGIATGFLLLVHARNAGLVIGLLALGAWLFARRRAAANLAAFAAGFTLLFAIRTLINFRFWGTWLTTPHARPGEWDGFGALFAEFGRRAAGMLVDQEYGLLPYAPIFLLVPGGLAILARSNRQLFAAISLVAGGYLFLVLLPLTNAHGWTGGWSPAARFWVPIVPLLALCIVAAAQRLPRVLVAMLVILQVLLNAYVWQNPKSAWNDGDGIAAVCARTGSTFCRYLPSFVIEQERQRPAQ